ncbi:hypothetical protein, conserved [Plasmodium gonderi]|uniref:GTP-binding protein n=1 Tax=Plasmodium gonderi TaxID=77519 RepID=A0A1Y1JEI5_PLAGO|nr:hypothetical protein, conserved [Plasmodium gonderi]GAW80906.1 hypothetical protein, conserved [Plasmodium gonderi]
MHRSPVVLRNFARTQKRHFINGSKAKLSRERKKEIIVLHPILKKSKHCNKSFKEILYDAQEALGLARSAGFKIANGISMPIGGWTFFKCSSDYRKENELNLLAKCHKEEEGNVTAPCQSYEKTTDENIFTGEEAPNKGESCLTHDDNVRVYIPSFDKDKHNKEIEKTGKEISKSTSMNVRDNVHYNYFEETNLQYDDIEKKIAESIMIKVNKIDSKFYFGKGKLNELTSYFLKNPTPYIFINDLLSPEQMRNLDMLFNSILQSYHDQLKLKRQREKGETHNTFRDTEFIYEDNECTDDMMNEARTYLDLYNDYMEKQEEEEENAWADEGDSPNDDNQINRNGESTKDKLFHQKKIVPLYMELFDRYSIILHILKSRAKNNLSKLQVELARANFIFNTYSEDNKSRMKYIKYVENNILGKSNIDIEEKYSQLNEFNGEKQNNKKKNYDHLGYTSNYVKSSETYKEYEKRIINNLYSKLRRELTKCKNNNTLQSSSRKHKALIAVVGYTNVGKTKLINYLTKSKLKAKNILFQTLDSSFKSMNISDGHPSIFIDSIGFIQNIPFSLYESFKISLESIKNADMLVHVIDVCHPYMEQHKKCVLDTLSKIGFSNEFLQNNMIEVWNKIDKLSDQQVFSLYKNKPINALPISAKVGTNCDILVNIIQDRIKKLKDVRVLTLQFLTKEAHERIPYLRKNFNVVPNSISYSSDGNTTFIKLVENPRNLQKYYETFGTFRK